MQEEGSYISLKNKFEDDFYHTRRTSNKIFDMECYLFGLKFYIKTSIFSNYCYFNKSNFDKKHLKFIVKNMDKFLSVKNNYPSDIYIFDDYLAIHYNDLIDLVKDYSLEEWFA